MYIYIHTYICIYLKPTSETNLQLYATITDGVRGVQVLGVWGAGDRDYCSSLTSTQIEPESPKPQTP